MLEEFIEMLEDRDRDNLPNVLLVAAECAPLSKTGGLADVVGTLPKSLKKLGVDARVITPYHRIIKEKYSDRVEHLFHFYVDLGWRHQYAGIEKLVLDGIIIYLVDSEYYYGDSIYRGGAAEMEQYAFFSRAVLDAMPILEDFNPEIVHCNDWHTAAIPMLARTQYRGAMQERRKYLITIHNIAFQGKWSFDYISDLLSIDSAYYTPEFIELNESANLLKAGCVFADRISTVSPTYAQEIKTPYYSEGLDGILNARSAQLSGILNGIDTETFNPENDSRIPASFGLNDMKGKAVCKKALQEKMGLEIRADVPLLAMVMRMTEQKGFELVMSQLDDIMVWEDVQFVLLGTGDARYEDFMREAEKRYPGRLCAYIGYNEDLAHLVYAGSDFFLMPSRFEPCGLSQMIAMRYGSLPIVRETGGLKDSVVPYNAYTGEGDGFSFANFDSGEMRTVVNYALSCYRDSGVMNNLISRAMSMDFSFEKSAEDYVRLYISMLDGYHETLPALVHDCREREYRKPYGAAESGSRLELTLKHLSGRMNGAQVLLDGKEYEMQQTDGIFHAEISAPEQPGVYYYIFRINTKYGDRYFCADETGLSGKMCAGPENGFQLTVYLKDFRTPEWFRQTVMYQIFPDRFGFSKKQGMQYHKKLGQTMYYHKSLDEPVKYLPGKGEKDYAPNDFYGGSFKGIENKLEYLKELGIGCIYLNPIVESPSNHRYDTSDYMQPDPILGSVEDFERLCGKARSLGIRIILDGVYSHTGADSRYFNRYGHYDSVGACQSEQSPYYPWYSFRSYPDDYKCWWDFRDLPEVDERNPEWQEYITGVIRTWLERGASGWRIDVADELPDDVLALFRQTVKGCDEDYPIIGEVWEDAVTKYGPEGRRNYALGYSLDSVMNYPLRFAVLDFIHRRKSAYEFRDFLISQQVNYPKPLYYSLMNLLSSHDVDRIRTALSTDTVIRSLNREQQLELKFDAASLKKAVKLEKLAAAIQFSIPGVPCIYYGDEQGMTGLCDPFNRMPYREDTENTGLHNIYKQLTARRNSSEVLKNGDAEFLALGYDVLAVIRFIDGMKPEITLVNRGDENFSYSFEFGSRRYEGTVKSLSVKYL